jgi:hypothetical protein
MFEAAKAKQPTKKSGKGKAAKPQFDIAALEEYAALKNASKQIEAALETLKEEVNEQAMDIFLNSQDPKSFQGVDGNTTASLQLRRRTSRSVLSEAEQELLDAHNIDTVKTEDSRFYIDRRYSDDQDLLAKVAAALEGVVPEDFFGHTGDKYVVGTDALSQALKVEDEDDRRSVVKVVGTQAARTNFGGSNEEALSYIAKLL